MRCLKNEGTCTHVRTLLPYNRDYRRTIGGTIILLGRFSKYISSGNLRRFSGTDFQVANHLRSDRIRALLNPSFSRLDRYSLGESRARRPTRAMPKFAKTRAAAFAERASTTRIILLLLWRTCNLYVTQKSRKSSFAPGLSRARRYSCSTNCPNNRDWPGTRARSIAHRFADLFTPTI